MSDTIEMFRAMKERNRMLKAQHGINCPGCKKKFPKAHPKILLPGQRCFCGYTDIRAKLCGCDTAPMVEQSQDGRLWYVVCEAKNCHRNNPTTRLCEHKQTAITEWNQRKYL